MRLQRADVDQPFVLYIKKALDYKVKLKKYKIMALKFESMYLFLPSGILPN